MSTKEHRGLWCSSSVFLDKQGNCRNPDGCACDAIERLERERDEAHASARMYEATAKEAARGLECLSDIDEAWDAFGTHGNRKALTLAEQISSVVRELDEAQNAAAFHEHNWQQERDLKLSLVAELSTLRARVARLEEALERIASRTQTEGLLWWQVEARAALAEQQP